MIQFELFLITSIDRHCFYFNINLINNNINLINNNGIKQFKSRNTLNLIQQLLFIKYIH